jgi:hypothetical protein
MGDLSIRIGAGSEVYKDVALAYSMRRGQKLSISGTGEDLYTALTTSDATKKLGNFADGIGTIKSSSDIVLSADEVTSAKAALLKLGTRSLVLQALVGTELASKVTQNFAALDATYTKFKSMNMSADPTITATDLNGIVNLQGIEKLSGKTVAVEATGAEIKDGMASLLKNVANIKSIKVLSGTAQFTVDQLRVLGDKLDPSGGGTIKLKDTADKLLQTSSINLINKLNNSYINSGNPKIATASAATAADDVITSAGHGLITGDKVKYIAGSNAITGLVSGTDYWARDINGGSFSLYASKAEALNVSSMTGRVNISADAALGNGSFVTSNADAPIRVTTLHVVDVTQASLAQVNQFTALTTPIAGNDDAREENRQMSSIIGNVEIKDIAANLISGNNEKGVTAATGGNAANGDSLLTTGTHGYEAGDAVLYKKATGGNDIGLTDGETYYVGKVSGTTFKLFDSRIHALAGNNNFGATGLKVLTANATAGDPHEFKLNEHSFITNDLTKAMSAVGRYKSSTGQVERVTVAGSGAITSTILDDVAARVAQGGAASGFSNATKITYSAKAIDIQGNLAALYDNMTKVGGKHIGEIVVSDGVINGKKTINLTIGQYNEMFDAFSKGVTNAVVGGNSDTPTNYAFNVTGAAYTDSKKAGQTNISITNAAGVTRNTALQDDKNVASFSLIGLNKGSSINGGGGWNNPGAFNTTTVNSLNGLRDLLSQSKLKTVLTNSQSANNWTLDDKNYLKTFVSNIGSNADRNKLKVVV